MPDLREFQKVVESAEKAAAAGDIASAEALLREAAELQEASHGPLHPDLASTFNNLAVVCEMAHKPTEAEQFYRRAYAIASWSLSPGHPMVATARDNLREFCVARGLPVEEWMDLRTGPHVAPPAPVGATAPAAAVPTAGVTAAPPTSLPVPAATTAVAAHQARPPARPAAPPPATPRPRRGLGVAAGVAVTIVAVLALLAFARTWRTPSSGGAAPTSAATTAPASTTTAPPAVAATPSAGPAAPAVPAAAPVSTPSAPAASAGVRVVTATVCSTLTTSAAWRCEAAGAMSAPGRLSYYTRVASPRGLRVQHRWYQGDRLRQDVTLRISANAVDGYRTFSRQTVAPGEWRVELRAENGALLDEARFVVR